MSTTDRPRLRSSTMGSIQSLTRALRESLRLRRLRKQKRRVNDANSQQMRRRSKSVGASYVEDEISEVGISAVIASDFGPMTTIAHEIKPKVINRKQSKSADEIELEKIKKQIDIEAAEKLAAGKNLSVNTGNSRVRRRSKDDHDLPKIVSDNEPKEYYAVEQKGFRKRFGRLFGSLRLKHQTHSHLQPESQSPSPTPDSSPADDHDVAAKSESVVDSDNK